MKIAYLILFMSFITPYLQAMEPVQGKSPDSLKLLASRALVSETAFIDQFIEATAEEAQQFIEQMQYPNIDLDSQQPFKQELIRRNNPQYRELVQIEKTFKNEKVLQIIGLGGSVSSVVFSHDNGQILYTEHNHYPQIRNLTENTSIILPQEGQVHSALFNHDDTKVVTATEDGTVTIWRLPKGILQSMSLPAIVLLFKARQYHSKVIDLDFYKKLYQGLTSAEQEIIKPYLNIQTLE